MTEKSNKWTFLTNHAHVFICLAREPQVTLRDVALQVGITERAVQRIVADLEDGGYIVRTKDGRTNRYRLSMSKKLRHPVERNCTLRELIDLIK
ncbi:helix-turn-helix transcriptional regulator [Pseudobacteriovorax antillogorgiicola]|uniref:MarR family protein n=1 Tax=Pseudobacteriovorax antillogorgiicola TaxID=1513793 RepID=A0A1Y6C5K2_9BACT|nr:winged helix-turn-helix domain-containing protein [Pseudobacteriovorax antillogorgiicola]TCS49423.1 MarR family protein [Pseudobacteriovorax antillogorgiicola]SMF46823.1 MarR family protein [Pseudobacteriovorax antillogorgiicola]